MPGQAQEFLLQLAEPPFGRADQVVNGRIALPHLGEDFLGGNAAIHHPDALGFAVLRFNLLQKLPQRGLIGGVARQHFVGQRKTLGVTINAMTTCTQSERLSRLYP